MIGLVLVTHGRLAAEFITALEHGVGPQPGVAGICIDADDDMEARRRAGWLGEDEGTEPGDGDA